MARGERIGTQECAPTATTPSTRSPSPPRFETPGDGASVMPLGPRCRRIWNTWQMSLTFDSSCASGWTSTGHTTTQVDGTCHSLTAAPCRVDT